MPRPLFHIVMYQPEIPNNTGNIGRTCIATGCALHLIHPLGFDTSVKALRRAGLDYWPRLTVAEHASWSDYRTTSGVPTRRLWLTSGIQGTPPWDCDLLRGDHIVFGPETRGLPDTLLDEHPDRIIRLPLIAGERGLNVATTVCSIVYEGVRQCINRNEITLEEQANLILDDVP